MLSRWGRASTALGSYAGAGRFLRPRLLVGVENFGYWVRSFVGSLGGRGWLRLDTCNGFSVD